MGTHLKAYPYKLNHDTTNTGSKEHQSLLIYRVFDILFSTIAILLLSPILIVVSIILKFTNDDKIFYTQERVGLGGKIFHVYKFTTMVKNSETMGSGTITLKNDSRVFPFGKFLRRTKVNELPQLFNILNGDMSIVGPRPLPMERYSNYSDEIKYNINKVLPGLSGVGSVLFRNEDEILNQVDASDKVEFYDKIIAPYKGAVEIWYVQNLSLYVYFTVIFMTAFVVVFPNRKVNYSKFFKGFPTPPEELKALL